ncbi:GNAT family N-acetyltransferase [Pseudovibrio sp. Tun.PSC04-5.I4]|uniref:GNAT family N-acetyltransferase n=1 Tax=Pseudovibrio sp. Tun.PSC04-5.I4 TaxID=1798213 RepID=UPI00088B0372|nr:GNAT family N-acetyltransferase [Pseudovibrio sp. Tun.PSC04-5.I4]SDR29323.1 Acetyltransferase (GNAT) family protein [Pseudovibrio sp. Tun.PSC04-5.I4]
MVTTEVKSVQPRQANCDLETVLRLEQANLNCFPSFMVHYDGSWVSRLSPGIGTRRNNSLNFYDAEDGDEVESRLDAARTRFKRQDIKFHVRWTPLVPNDVDQVLNQRNFQRLDETLVMTRSIWVLGETEVPAGFKISKVPLAEWIYKYAQAYGAEPGAPLSDTQQALYDVLSRITVELIALVLETEDGVPVAVLLGVVDGDLLGIFDVATGESYRRQGLAFALMCEVHRLGAERGAETAWLQVVAENTAASALYDSLGYKESYAYHYCHAPRA